MVFIFVALIIIAVVLLFFGQMAGHRFRSWNEGDNYKGDEDSPALKTIIIGVILVIIVVYIVSQGVE